ncbi:MAG: protein NO VEIN domain-containing protein [Terriglobales bacterium]
MDDSEYLKSRKRNEKWFYILVLAADGRVWARILKETRLGSEPSAVAKVIRKAIAETHGRKRALGVVHFAGGDLRDAASQAALEHLVATRLERSAGFQSNPAIRKAIEDWAMKCARKYLRQRYTHIRDTSATKPFDFTCRRGKTAFYVEVKGTQTAGVAVALTPNEKKHAEENPANSVLYVQHSIRVLGRKKPKAFGGERRVLNPWDISEGTLKPSGWLFVLPRRKK